MNGLLSSLYPALRRVLFRLPPERAHQLGLKGLDCLYRAPGKNCWFPSAQPVVDKDVTPINLMGLHFPNRVGLAAGLDKNGAYIDALAALGFGFIEVGTVTPKPQPGNPKPRLFRLTGHQAIINRMGFNNDGIDALVRNVERARWNGVIGINIGKNKDTPNERALDDYLHCLERAWDVAGYIVVNISSPNTAGLRALQFGEPLRALVGGLRESQARLAAARGNQR